MEAASSLNVCKYLPDYTASHPIGLQSSGESTTHLHICFLSTINFNVILQSTLVFPNDIFFYSRNPVAFEIVKAATMNTTVTMCSLYKFADVSEEHITSIFRVDGLTTFLLNAGKIL
jgi:hypothetical protein